MKKVISALLAFILVFSSIPMSSIVDLCEKINWGFFSLKANAWFSSGRCGENVFWTYSSDTGILSITGTGNMYNSSLTSDYFTYNNAHFCNSIKQIVIGEGVTSIGDYMFNGDSDHKSYRTRDLESITLPSTLKFIGGEVFYSAQAFDVYISDLASFCSLNSGIYLRENIYCNGELISGELVIPEGVKIIGSKIFYSNSKITSVVFPSSVEYVAYSALCSCPNLKCVSFKENLPDFYCSMTNNPISTIYYEGDIVKWKSYNLDYMFPSANIICEKKYDINNINISLSGDSFVYDGFEQKPIVTIQDLKLNTDFTTTYSNNINKGTATVNVKGIGSYCGEKTIEFSIKAADISSAIVTGVSDFTYTGNIIEQPQIVVKVNNRELKNGIDYDITYSSNKSAGNANYSILGKGNYTGVCLGSFIINRKSIADLNICGFSDECEFTGFKISQNSLEIFDGDKKLINGADYSLSYSNNVSAGEATLLIAGMGNYSESKILTYTISPINIQKLTIEGFVEKSEFTGLPIKQNSLKVKYGNTLLHEGTDYEITYKNNINCGEAKCIITCKGNYIGKETINYNITPIDATKLVVEGIVEENIYTSCEIEQPSLCVKYGQTILSEGKDFNIYYKDNINCGEAKVIIVCKGNYTGTIEKSFNINTYLNEIPHLNSISNVGSGVKITWDKTEHANSYNVYRRTANADWTYLKNTSELFFIDSTANNGCEYYYTVRGVNFAGYSDYDECGLKTIFLSQPKLKTVNYKNGISIEWSSVSGAEGYVIKRKGETETNWTEIKIIKDIDVLKYLDTKVKTGVIYQYEVLAFKNEFDSACCINKLMRLSQPIPQASLCAGYNKITWNKISGAESYFIYRKSKGDSSWKKITEIKTNSYSDKSVKSGETYKYTVRTVNKLGNSSYDSTGISIKYLGYPQAKASIGNGCINIKWNKISGAQGYYIYRKTGKDNYSKIATIKNVSTISYSDKKVKYGVSYTYVVKAYVGKYLSSCKSISAKLLDSVTPILSNGNGGVDVSWKIIKGANSYIIYRKTSNSEYSVIATTDSSTTKYKDKSAKSGTSYIYAVRACSGKFKSNFKGKSIKYIAAVKISKIHCCLSGIRLIWGKINGAKGYYIFRRVNNGKWKLVKTISNGSTTSYIDTSGNTCTTYEYLIKAYNGKCKGTANNKAKAKVQSREYIMSIIDDYYDDIDILNSEIASLQSSNSYYISQRSYYTSCLSQASNELSRANSTKVKVYVAGYGWTYQTDKSAVKEAQQKVDMYRSEVNSCSRIINSNNTNIAIKQKKIEELQISIKNLSK